MVFFITESTLNGFLIIFVEAIWFSGFRMGVKTPDDRLFRKKFLNTKNTVKARPKSKFYCENLQVLRLNQNRNHLLKEKIFCLIFSGNKGLKSRKWYELHY